MAATEPLALRVCGRRRVDLGGTPWILAALGALGSRPVQAQSSVDLSYLYYQEAGGRIQVLDPMLLLHQDFGKSLGQLDLLLSHDAVSGASPTGGYPTLSTTTTTSASGVTSTNASGQIPMVQFNDQRRAESLTYSRAFGAHLPSIDLSHSTEKDYVANGFGLSDAWTLAGGRGTLHYGASFSNDLVEPVTNHLHLPKKTRSYALGWTWILGEDDLFDVSTSWTRERGDLDEPYLIVPMGTGTLSLSDHRPEARTRQAFLLKDAHYFPWDGALKTSYRYYRDDWSVRAHTLAFTYDQHVDDGWIVSPSLRFYTQSRASFYSPLLAAPQPYRSADYRLSALDSAEVGLTVSCEIQDGLTLHVGGTYQLQQGRDPITPLVRPATATSPAVFSGPGTSAADLNTATFTVGLTWRY